MISGQQSDAKADSDRLDDDALIRQYEMLGTLYNSESARYWIRFNIFLGSQFAILIAIITQITFLSLNPHIFRALIVFLGVLSILIVIIIHRGLVSIKLIYGLANELEEKSQGRLILMSMISSRTRVIPLVNQFICSLIALIFAACWWLMLAYLESISYRVVLPKP